MCFLGGPMVRKFYEIFTVFRTNSFLNPRSTPLKQPDWCSLQPLHNKMGTGLFLSISTFVMVGNICLRLPI